MKTPEGRNESWTIWKEIDLTALRFNIGQIRKIVKDKKLLLTIKADAYGHSAENIAKTAVSEKIDMLGIAGIEEGIKLRRKGIEIPILLLTPAAPPHIGKIIENNITPTISNIYFADILSTAAVNIDRVVKVHIEIDTGMGRTGVRSEEAVDFIQRIANLPNIEIEGIFTHFPLADSSQEFTHRQLKEFLKIDEELKIKGINIPIRHTSNSAAILYFPESHLDMVRPGIMSYGLYPAERARETITLKPIMSLKTRIIHIQNIERGEGISYGHTFIAERPMRAATIQAGYGDGYRRNLSNKAEVLVKGKRCRVLGTVCMDMTMIDITGVRDVQLWDEVVLIGKDNEQEITAEEVAEWSGTINYEITTGISKSVPKSFYW